MYKAEIFYFINQSIKFLKRQYARQSQAQYTIIIQEHAIHILIALWHLHLG